MSLTEPGLERFQMSWEEYLELPEKPKAEWVDGEVVVTPPVSGVHGVATSELIVALHTALPELYVVTEVGLWLPRNRLRAPDVMVTTHRPGDPWVTTPPVLVAEVLSRSTRTEDTMRKAPEYAAGGVGQYWLVDPDAGSLDVFVNVDGRWERFEHLDARRPAGVVSLGEHGEVPIDLARLFRT